MNLKHVLAEGASTLPPLFCCVYFIEHGDEPGLNKGFFSG